MEFTKTDDNKLKVSNTLYYPDGSAYIQDQLYDRQFLENHILSITVQRDEMISLKNKELNEVNTLIAKCDELGITISVIEEVTPINDWISTVIEKVPTVI